MITPDEADDILAKADIPDSIKEFLRQQYDARAIDKLGLKIDWKTLRQEIAALND